MKPKNTPKASIKKHDQIVHGITLKDNYFWMRDRNEPEVIEYLNAENDYTDSILKPTEIIQKELYDEMVARIKETDISVPVLRANYRYYTRTVKGLQYPIYCRKRVGSETEEILLDVNKLAEGSDYYDVGTIEVSSDHKYFAYATDQKGNEVYTLRIKSLADDSLLPDVLEGLGSSFEWAEDHKTIFYVTLDESLRPYKLWRHELGTAQSEDVELFCENDEHYFMSLYKTKDLKYIVLDLESKMTSEQHTIRACSPFDNFKVIQPRQTGLEYSVEHHGDQFYILTNDQAENFKLMSVSDDSPAKNNWQEVIPYRPEVKLEDLEVFKDYLVLFERFEGCSQIQVIEIESREASYLDFEEAAFTAWCGENVDFKSDLLRFGYSSLITPNSVFEVNLKTRDKKCLKQQEVMGGYDSEDYRSERLMAVSKDGTRVPVSIVYHKGFVANGEQACHLYGYGSYGHSLDPLFSSTRLSLLNRGFVYVIAHVRGGGDLGRPWYNQGKLNKKQNTFDDFISVAELLIEKRYTSKNKLCISGGSAGGLLMGAVVNQRPDLFYGCIMDVPFVDVLNTMLDPTIPLTITEYEEWGNPQEKKYFDCISAYSPYDNIQAQNYPHLMVTAGLNDPRVQYWEPAKWTAKLREFKTDENILILKTHMGAGHGGPTGRYEYLKEVARDYAFFLYLMGRSQP